MILLEEHVKQIHDSNLTAAATAHGTSRTNLYNWIDQGAIVVEGKIYCPVRTRNMGKGK